MRALLLITAAAAILAAPVLADTKAGVEAWERGDYKSAVDQWRQQAANGDADAMFNLGQAYKLGRGVPVDTQKSESYYRQAADKGHEQAADYYGLALFQNGKPRDAVPYLEKSSARGEPRAQYILGTMLFNGIDIKKDWVRAYALLTQAQRAGLPQAANTIQQMDQYIPAEQRQQGVAMAQRMAPPPIPTGEVSGGTRGGIRSADLPPSQVGQTPIRTAPVRTPPVAVAPPSPRPPVTRTAPPPVAVARGNWRLQLGAFGDPGNARRLGAQMAGRFPGRSVDYVKSGNLTRVLVGPFGSRGEAQAACRGVSPCVPVER